MKKQFNNYYIALFFLCFNFTLFAQPGSGNGTGDLESTDTPAAPIDDFIWILALLGLIFVFIKLKSYSRKKELYFKNIIVVKCQKSINLKTML